LLWAGCTRWAWLRGGGWIGGALACAVARLGPLRRGSGGWQPLRPGCRQRRRAHVHTSSQKAPQRSHEARRRVLWRGGHTVFIPFAQIHIIARYRHILTQTPKKGTTRKSCNHKRQRATRATIRQRHRATADAELNQAQSTGHSQPNRTTPLHYRICRPGQAGAKTTAQSTSQEPITIPVYVEVAPAHSYTQLPNSPGHEARLAYSSSRLRSLLTQAGQEAKRRLAEIPSWRASYTYTNS
jgi:hypothetical protein